MTKESAYELQLIDCNCNDCANLVRQLDKLNLKIENDKLLQKEIFELTKERKINKTKTDIANLLKHVNLIKNADEKIRNKREYLQTVKESVFHYQGQQKQIQYGFCKKLNKDISFAANTCQIDTQKCFEHRKAATA